jgi:hypothetical protein
MNNGKLCNNIIRAEADIKNLKDKDQNFQDWRDDVNKSIGEIKTYAEKLVVHQLKQKHWPEDLKEKNGNNGNIKEKIKEKKLEIVSGVIILVTFIVGLVSSLFN